MRWRAVLCLLTVSALAAMPLTDCSAGGDVPSAQSDGPPLVEEAVQPATASPVMGCLYYERELFLSAMAAPRDYRREGRLAAGVIPHHLLAADMIAGFFRLAAEEPEGYDTVLLISPSHFPENCGSDVVTSTWGWDTPYGPVQADGDLAGMLLQNTAVGAEDNPAAVEFDHGVAGLVPFVRYYLPDAKVTACLLSNRLDRPRLAALQQQVAEICAGGRVLLVASVDFSHYLTPEDAALRDTQTADAIAAMDLVGILAFSDANVDSPQSLTTFLAAARAWDGDVRQLDHSSSAEKLPHAIANPIYQEGVTTYFVYGAFTGQGDNRP